MKHFNAKLIFALLVFSINVSLLNAQRHFHLNLSKQCLSAESALTEIQQTFKLDPNSHFEQINDRKDELGMQHLTYKQYLYDFEIVGCMVLVHLKNGVVQSMNGMIMEQEILPFEKNSLTRSSIKMEGEKVYIPIETEEKTTIKLAIKQLDKKSQSEIYLDANTGDTLRTISLRNFLDGNTNAKIDYINYFPYKDSEEIEILECKFTNNNLYSLQDSYRNFLHISSSVVTLSDFGIYSGFEHIAVRFHLDSLKNTFKFNGNLYEGCSLKITLYPKTNPDSILYSTMKQNHEWNNYFDIIIDEEGYLNWDKVWGVGEEVFFNFKTQPLEINEDCILKVEFKPNDLYSSDKLSITDTWEISFKDAKKTELYIPQILESQSKNNLTLNIYMKTKRNPSCEIFWGLQKTYDYFYEQFGIKGYNNKNSKIRTLYDDFSSDTYSEHHKIVGEEYAIMNFGAVKESSGDKIITIPQVSLDIVAHEYSHLVVSQIGNGELKSHGETGALCESFADIFASAVMNRYKGNNSISDYLIGEEVTLNAKCLRSLAADQNGIDGILQPQCYHGKNWDAYYNDFGTNSGVQNRWFYLLCNSEESVSGTNDFGYEYEIKPITLSKGEQIVFRNLNFYLTPFANYHDAAMGSLQATADLYGINSDEFNSVLEAWCAVGICLDDRIEDIADETPSLKPDLPLVYTENGNICVKAHPNSIVKIFSPIGMLIEQRTTNSDLERFTIPNLKIAIVMVNNISFKIIIP